MLLRITLVSALALSLLCAAAPSFSDSGPKDLVRSTPLTRMFDDWLAIFNSGDPARIKAFYATYLNNPNPVFALESAEDTCGLIVDKIAARRAGKLLSPPMLRLATTPSATPWYGLGFIVNSKIASWGHGGNSYGMDVAAHFYPTIDTTFICVAARDMVCNRLIYAWFLRTFNTDS